MRYTRVSGLGIRLTRYSDQLPDFIAKARRVVGLYLVEPEKARLHMDTTQAVIIHSGVIRFAPAMVQYSTTSTGWVLPRPPPVMSKRRAPLRELDHLGCR